MKSGWGIVGVFAALAIVVMPSAGCTINACPAIGYIRTLTVNIEGNVAAVSDVSVCNESGCSQPEPTAASPAPLKSVVTEFSPEPQPTASHPPFYGHRYDQDTWVFNVAFGDPAKVAVKALASEGTVLAEQEHDLVWTMVGGTAQCGGPVTTPPIQLSVP
ncbi:hypothetical protein [Arthrobacter sp. S39]|uniref:hypothetical protein n=1 Tax=Arthrobacter sp. S39 TaxID=2509720 RepID=UPI0013EFAEAF|nr:hypothetical protein [Arthrobacter sp. S39]